MEFNSQVVEEDKFQRNGVSLDEGREIRYLINNTFDFMYGDIVKMLLTKEKDIIIANGLYGSDFGNKTFKSYILKIDNGYSIRSDISNLDGKGTFPSDTIFIYEGDNIKVIGNGKVRIISKRSNEETINR